MKLIHPRNPSLVIETEPDLARPYLSQGWVEQKAAPRRQAAKKAATADRASTESGDAAPTTEKENSDGD